MQMLEYMQVKYQNINQGLLPTKRIINAWYYKIVGIENMYDSIAMLCFIGLL